MRTDDEERDWDFPSPKCSGNGRNEIQSAKVRKEKLTCLNHKGLKSGLIFTPKQYVQQQELKPKSPKKYVYRDGKITDWSRDTFLINLFQAQ